MGQERYFFGEDWLSSKAKLFSLLEYKVYDEPVKQFHESFANRLIASAPARTSKSFSTYPELVHDGFPKMDWSGKRPVPVDTGLDEILIWLVGTDYDTIKEWDYVWSALIDKELLSLMGAHVEKAHNSPKQGNMMIVARWPKTVNGKPLKSVWQGKSANNQKSLQGEEVKTAVMSEAKDHDRVTNEKYLDTRCNRIIYPTTPGRAAVWLYEMIEASLTDKTLGIEAFSFTRKCNPRYDHNRYRRAKKKAALLYGDASNSPGFLEEFEGEWTFEGGKVLPFRWIETAGLDTHVIDYDPAWLQYAFHFVSMDYGYSDPAVMLFWALSNEGDLVIYDMIYERSLSNPEFVRRGRKLESEWGFGVKQWIPDPQKPELTKLIREYKLPVFAGIKPGVQRDRASSAQALVDLLSPNPDTGKIRLKVHSRCEPLIAEWKNLRRRDDHFGDEWSEAALKGRDDCFDAARYGAAVIRKKKTPALDGQDWYKKFMAARRQREMRKRYQTPASELYGNSDIFQRLER